MVTYAVSPFKKIDVLIVTCFYFLEHIIVDINCFNGVKLSKHSKNGILITSVMDNVLKFNIIEVLFNFSGISFSHCLLILFLFLAFFQEVFMSKICFKVKCNFTAYWNTPNIFRYNFRSHRVFFYKAFSEREVVIIF